MKIAISAVTMCCSRHSRSMSSARSSAATRSTANDRHADDRILQKIDNENNAVYEQSERVSDHIVQFIYLVCTFSLSEFC